MSSGTDRQDAAELSPGFAGQDDRAKGPYNWRTMRNQSSPGQDRRRPRSTSTAEKPRRVRARWNMGMMNDPETDEVPGSVLLLSKVSEFNEPLGLRNTPARTSASSLPHYSDSRRSSIQTSQPHSAFRRRISGLVEKKRTADGKFVLEPQPDDSLNDPLNWKVWRRDAALLSLGFYCMLGGGMTPILAAGFNEVAIDYDVSVPDVALTTGLYMLGLGLGSVLLSPTAILFGKRPVYLIAAVCFVLTAVWCALSPNFVSLVLARIFMGLAVSSVECLPSATVAEIYFLHEKAYRLGIYTLLLLGGKNLIPLVSAVIIEALGWRWVFWIVAIVVGFAACLLFIFVPETFWDRTPVPNKPRPSRATSRSASILGVFHRHPQAIPADAEATVQQAHAPVGPMTTSALRHAHFEDSISENSPDDKVSDAEENEKPVADTASNIQARSASHRTDTVENSSNRANAQAERLPNGSAEASRLEVQMPSVLPPSRIESPLHQPYHNSANVPNDSNAYTTHYSSQPPKSFLQQMAPFSGRLNNDNWFRVAVRPFVLFAYPSILWSTLVYSLSIGWLIVLSESVSTIYEKRDAYNFTPLQTGLVYISPFIGGILGTAVAGKCSDLIVRFMARRNGGIYEPEFRLVMAIPIALTTVIGLMGYGWSAAERDNFYVPTFFFGLISFGCSLGSTTSITFAVDSYRQYAGEALVTLNFSKNIFHGLVFSLFFNKWLQSEGSKDVFLAIGGIQLGCLLTTLPMYVYGKRARMWTVRKKLMERF